MSAPNEYSQKNLEDIRDLLLIPSMAFSKVGKEMTRRGIPMTNSAVSGLWNRGIIQKVCSPAQERIIQNNIEIRKNNPSYGKPKKPKKPDKPPPKAQTRFDFTNPKKVPPAEVKKPLVRSEPAPIVLSPGDDTSKEGIDHIDGKCPFMYPNPKNPAKDFFCNADSINELVGKEKKTQTSHLSFGKSLLAYCPKHAKDMLGSSERKAKLEEALHALRTSEAANSEAELAKADA
ncbi:MAG: hypothetical protein ABA06_00670 [Parcubacteria bacterium C7867-001]|nr:MAG: hypothetical protein ABA06_00670 [Parcubacteria bacterium C7867-001]